MKTTKKDIYASFGIEYDPKTQKIKTPYGWTRELLKKGNSKVGANVKTWSMNTSTCFCHCEGCHKCSISKYVLFLEHSTRYDAKSDPLFDTLAAIINNQ